MAGRAGNHPGSCAAFSPSFGWRAGWPDGTRSDEAGRPGGRQRIGCVRCARSCSSCPLAARRLLRHAGSAACATGPEGGRLLHRLGRLRPRLPGEGSRHQRRGEPPHPSACTPSARSPTAAAQPATPGPTTRSRSPAADSVDGVADRPDDPLRGNFGQLRKLKAKHPGLRVIWSFGGWTGSAGFTEAARDPAAFAASCRGAAHRPALVRALRRHRRRLGISERLRPGLRHQRPGRAAPGAGRAAVGARARTPWSPRRCRPTSASWPPPTIAAAARIADWLSAMTYDYFGTGSDQAPHRAAFAADRLPRHPARDRDHRRPRSTSCSGSASRRRRCCSASASTAAAGPG